MNITPTYLVTLSLLGILATSLSAAAFTDEELTEQVEICSSCHGEAGVPEDPEIPIIWGQEYYYIYVQLKDYKAKRREHEIMSEIAAEFDKTQMKALAQHFSEKEWPGIEIDAEAVNAAASTGEAMLAAGQCSQCHSTYSGDSRVPRLAGQRAEYLAKTMTDFKEKIRLNSPAKGSLMGSFSYEQIEASAHFLSGL